MVFSSLSNQCSSDEEMVLALASFGLSSFLQVMIVSVNLVTQETLDPISIENNQIFPREVNLNLTSVLCTIQK